MKELTRNLQGINSLQTYNDEEGREIYLRYFLPFLVMFRIYL